MPACICKTVGGTTTHSAGAPLRLQTHEFRARSTFGEITGANLMDWPVSLGELEPPAADFCCASPDVGVIQSVPQRKLMPVEDESVDHVSKTRITENGCDQDPIPAGAVEPQVITDAHAAEFGMVFYTGKSFPAMCLRGFFSAQHGFFNRTWPVGACALRVVEGRRHRRQGRGFRRGLTRQRHQLLSRPPGRRCGYERRFAACR